MKEIQLPVQTYSLFRPNYEGETLRIKFKSIPVTHELIGSGMVIGQPEVRFILSSYQKSEDEKEIQEYFASGTEEKFDFWVNGAEEKELNKKFVPWQKIKSITTALTEHKSFRDEWGQIYSLGKDPATNNIFLNIEYGWFFERNKLKLLPKMYFHQDGRYWDEIRKPSQQFGERLYPEDFLFKATLEKKYLGEVPEMHY